ncbi:hypothetical protein TRAPUB_980 [Trametes pubescens]|uniref:Uncharacterized protein n=1 Tax=Trametes pubescens TaxID=154538 RepID=A0A1M2VKJ7_TRAPU|nr:hypothetical protein TRAPUB_980 [Trametes pubescens]
MLTERIDSSSSSTLRKLVFFLTFLVAANVLFVLALIRAFSGLIPLEKEYSYVGDDFPAELPLNLPPAALVLSSDATHFSLTADDDWGTLFPLSDGFTTLRASGSANAPGRTFLVSMVHQLHCLDAIRVAFVTNRTGAAHHVEHCLRYLRQTVLCHADTTLEPDEPGVRDGRWEHAASGVGAVHRCRDWTVLRKWLDEHPAEPLRGRANDSLST